MKSIRNEHHGEFMKNLIIILLLATSVNVFAAGKGVDVTVNLTPLGSFHVTSPKIKGKLIKKGNKFMGKEISLKVQSMKTGIDLRDEHMKKRLNPKKHPKIIVSNIVATGGKGKGKIKINGITKPFNFTYKISGQLMEANFNLSLSSFKIKDLSYMGVGAKDIVEINANIPVK